jgi:lysozyme
MIECADFSHWQTSVDFVALKAAGVAAVFLKATQGEGWIDQTFTQRCVEAHAAGLLYGAYHFCDDSPPAMQTAHFLAVAAGCTPVLALDVEWNESDTVSIKQAAEMVARIQMATRRVPVIYMGQYGPNKDGTGLPNSVLSRCPLWIPNDTATSEPPLPPGWSNWTFWQYADEPHDKDRFNGSLAELEAFWGGSV